MTFLATLVMAPAIANGILLGIVLTVLLYMIKSMRPRAEIFARKPDGTLGGIKAHNLAPVSETVVPVRFDGSLTFSTVAYFEDIVPEAIADFPKTRVILIIGSGINEIDASGEGKVNEVAKQLRDAGIGLYFSGLKHQVMSVFEKTGIVEALVRTMTGVKPSGQPERAARVLDRAVVLPVASTTSGSESSGNHLGRQAISSIGAASGPRSSPLQGLMSFL